MPNASPLDHETTRPTVPCPIDDFWPDIVRDVHKRLEDVKRRRLRNQQTFSIPETAELTGLPAPEVWKLIENQEIDANEVRRPRGLTQTQV